MRLEQLDVVFGVLFALALRLLCPLVDRLAIEDAVLKIDVRSSGLGMGRRSPPPVPCSLNATPCIMRFRLRACQSCWSTYQARMPSSRFGGPGSAACRCTLRPVRNIWSSPLTHSTHRRPKLSDSVAVRPCATSRAKMPCGPPSPTERLQSYRAPARAGRPAIPWCSRHPQRMHLSDP